MAHYFIFTTDFMMYLIILTCVLCTLSCLPCLGRNSYWNDLNLPFEHLRYFLNSRSKQGILCSSDQSCPFKEQSTESACWGYEDWCSFRSPEAYSKMQCLGDHKGWVSSKKDQIQLFFDQADFGFIKQQRQEIKWYCTSNSSSLACSDHMKFCTGRNIFLDLRRLKNRATPIRYHMDVLQHGDIGGHCRLDADLLARNCDQLSPLQSWGPELRHFTDRAQEPAYWPCDFWFDRPVIVTKIDAAVSLYHHFCDFVNLYMSQHLNNTDQHAFSTDVQVLIWESYPYRSNFFAAWRAFTRHPLLTLDDVAGKRVCFKEVMFPLLPRMIFGLYYNTPIVWGCESSGLFHAFNRHFLHRLRIPIRDGSVDNDATDLREILGTVEPRNGDGLVHITLLERQTPHRRILNQKQLENAIKKRSDVFLTVAAFEHGQSFLGQLQIITNTDVLIGIHGAGLTHMLFLPDWGQVFELYNCGDEHCYKDLARLRGLPYYTWRYHEKMKAEDEGHHPQLGAHEKFTNYEFDVEEFLAILDDAVSAVKRHKKWRQYQTRGAPKDRVEL